MIQIPDKIKYGLAVKTWAFFRVPLLHWVNPRIEALNTEATVISIPLGRRQSNHLGSMYFGVLCCGCDMAGGLLAMKLIWEAKAPVSLIFKDLNAQFLKRAESRTYFTCHDGAKIQQLVEKAITTGERVNETVNIIATCPDKLGQEPVARFAMTLSLKKNQA